MNTAVVDVEDVAWFRDNLGASRGAASALCRRLGFAERRCAEVALAVAEVVSNLTRHAVDGAIVLRAVRTDAEAGLEVVAMDRGPGIADTYAALQDGTSSAGTLGIGLGAIARLADAFDIYSRVGQGTVLAARFWPQGQGADSGDPAAAHGAERAAAGITRAISGEEVCGDGWAVRADRADSADNADRADSPRGPGRFVPASADARENRTVGQDRRDSRGSWGRSGGVPASAARTRGADERHAVGPGNAVLLMLCDGLGHGPMAARATEAAKRSFLAGTTGHPEDIVREIDAGLRGTRGAAVAVARIEPDTGTVIFCGIGNISALLIGTDSQTGLPSHPGIVGHHLRGVRGFAYPLPPGGALVMHSDGVSNKWKAGDFPGLFARQPVIVAAHLLAQAGTRRDDAGVLVVKDLW